MNVSTNDDDNSGVPNDGSSLGVTDESSLSVVTNKKQARRRPTKAFPAAHERYELFKCCLKRDKNITLRGGIITVGDNDKSFKNLVGSCSVRESWEMSDWSDDWSDDTLSQGVFFVDTVTKEIVEDPSPDDERMEEVTKFYLMKKVERQKQDAHALVVTKGKFQECMVALVFKELPTIDLEQFTTTSDIVLELKGCGFVDRVCALLCATKEYTRSLLDTKEFTDLIDGFMHDNSVNQDDWSTEPAAITDAARKIDHVTKLLEEAASNGNLHPLVEYNLNNLSSYLGKLKTSADGTRSQREEIVTFLGDEAMRVLFEAKLELPASPCSARIISKLPGMWGVQGDELQRHQWLSMLATVAKEDCNKHGLEDLSSQLGPNVDAKVRTFVSLRGFQRFIMGETPDADFVKKFLEILSVIEQIDSLSADELGPSQDLFMKLANYASDESYDWLYDKEHYHKLINLIDSDVVNYFVNHLAFQAYRLNGPGDGRLEELEALIAQLPEEFGDDSSGDDNSVEGDESDHYQSDTDH